jgi:hypothetical protein
MQRPTGGKTRAFAALISIAVLFPKSLRPPQPAQNIADPRVFGPSGIWFLIALIGVLIIGAGLLIYSVWRT